MTNTQSMLSVAAVRLWQFLSEHNTPTCINYATRRAIQLISGAERYQEHEPIFELHEAGLIAYEGYYRHANGGYYYPVYRMRLLVNGARIMGSGRPGQCRY